MASLYTEAETDATRKRPHTLVLAAATTRGLLCTVLCCEAAEQTGRGEGGKAEGRDGVVLTEIPFLNTAQRRPCVAEAGTAPQKKKKKKHQEQKDIRFVLPVFFDTNRPINTESEQFPAEMKAT